MNSEEFAIKVLEQKIKQKKESIIWLKAKQEKEPNNRHWKKMIDSYYHKQLSCEKAIEVLKDE